MHDFKFLQLNISQNRLMQRKLLHSEQNELAYQISKTNQSLWDCQLGESPLDIYLIRENQTEDIFAKNIEVNSSGNNITDMFTSFSLFDKIEEIRIEENFENKIHNLKMNSLSSKRKCQLFQRNKRQQQEKILMKKKQASKGYELKQITKPLKNEFTLFNQITANTNTTNPVRFPLTLEDFDKLRPETDINDTIVSNYLKLLPFFYKNMNLSQKIHYFSTFFLEKLINQYLKQEIIIESRDSTSLMTGVREKVKQNYKNVKKWTKNVDVFKKEILVFPINAFKHWYCVIVIKPGLLLEENSKQKCQLIYCDSMFQRREFIDQSIRKYLQYELEDKKQIKRAVSFDQKLIPCYQLLLPRQTNTHDCGLYMISYIEQLISRDSELKNLHKVCNRRKLNLFPRVLIYTMRQRLKNLFTKLINTDKEQLKKEIIEKFRKEKEKIILESDKGDYDEINEKEYKKYEKMKQSSITNISSVEEKTLFCQIAFYLDPQVNYYEKDRII